MSMGILTTFLFPYFPLTKSAALSESVPVIVDEVGNEVDGFAGGQVNDIRGEEDALGAVLQSIKP